MRSGTTWLASILNLHPRVWIGGEFHFELLARGMHRFMHEPWSLGSRMPLRNHARAALEGLISAAMTDAADGRLEGVPGRDRWPDGPRWIGDRTPSIIEPLLPGARYFHITRDGRDVLVSWTFHQLAMGGPFAEPHRAALAPQREQFARDPAHFVRHPEALLTSEPWVREWARHWASFQRARAELQPALDAGTFPGRVCDVRYETLHDDTERERQRIYRFLDLDPAEAGPLRAADHTAPGFDREDPTSFYRRGVPGDWRRFVNGRWERWFADVAGAWLGSE